MPLLDPPRAAGDLLYLAVAAALLVLLLTALGLLAAFGGTLTFADATPVAAAVTRSRP